MESEMKSQNTTKGKGVLSYLGSQDFFHSQYVRGVGCVLLDVVCKAHSIPRLLCSDRKYWIYIH